MSVIGSNILAGASSSQGYQISRSVRLRSSASAYFNRTFGSNGNQQQWTWSGWTKAGRFGSQQPIFNAYSSATNYGLFAFSASGFISATDTLKFYTTISNVSQAALQTAAVFRDPSAWYHVVLQVDTTQATSTNRIRIYVNGVLQTLTGTQPSQNANIGFFNTTSVPHQIGSLATGTYGYYDGYLTEINFIDGQALTPSSFGETNAVTGVWQPKKYAGTYGTNGFYLNFSDNSAATAAAIGKDYSGNGNNWTPNNISVTAGVTYDSMLDVPTLWADGGNGRGNYATWNPLDKKSTNITVSNGNLTASMGAVAESIRATIGMSSGKWYWENTITSRSGSLSIGILNGSASLAGYVGQNAGGWAYWYDGRKVNNGSFVAYGASYTTGDVVGITFDADAREISFYKNGVSQGVAYTGIAVDTYFPAMGNGGSTVDVNFGQRPFAYTPPTGFKALNTLNLPEPTILKGNQYFDATLYTGNGGTQSVVNAGGFQPDLVWIKLRDTVSDHDLIDSVRGATKVLESNLTGAEFTEAQNLQSFNSNGFTVGSVARVNGSGKSIVGWQWKEGATQGFDIVTWAGNSTSGRTIAHSLGVAPSMIITKSRTNPSSWVVGIGGMSGFGVNDYLTMNTTSAKGSSSTFYQAYGASTFTVGVSAADEMNKTGNNYVSYLFAEVAGFSKFGSYVGNGSSTDGPFVYCGFRPRYVMVKRTDSTASWYVYDTSRNTYNTMNNWLAPNLSNAENTATTWEFDFLSNGFKVRNNGAFSNASGGTYIYAAFAENPFKNALAR